MTIDRPLLLASWRSWITADLHPPVGPAWLQLLWTLLFCAGLALFFTLLAFPALMAGGSWYDPARWVTTYGRNLVVCLCIGLLIHALFAALRQWRGLARRVDRWRPWQQTMFFSAIPLLGLALGWPLGMTLVGQDLLAWLLSPKGSRMLVWSVLLSLAITLVLHLFFLAKSREIRAEQRASEAQLRLLQAQIEPHFLFNTLANVCSLIEYDAPRARQMLEAFTDYLRASLGTLRHDKSSLAVELGLAEAYLGLLKMRMEDRLQYRIDCPDELKTVALPPLLLQPLLENAIQHGLEPQIDGGQVQLRVWAEGDRLQLEVLDNGRGLAAAARPGARRGAGLALDNIRARLQTAFGSNASLQLNAASPGTRALITLPLPR